MLRVSVEGRSHQPPTIEQEANEEVILPNLIHGLVLISVEGRSIEPMIEQEIDEKVIAPNLIPDWDV